MTDLVSKRSRNIPYLSYLSCLFIVEKYHTVNGQSVAVKKALPKDTGSGGGMGGMGGGRGGRGGFNRGFARNDNSFEGEFSGGHDSGSYMLFHIGKISCSVCVCVYN
jgi:hypothetical protein